MENAHATTVEALEARSRLIRTPVAYTRGWLEWRIWGEGPPLVLIHGGHGSWTHWIRTIPALSRHFTVVALDLPGYGSSDPPASAVADPDELARLLGDGLPAVTGDNRFGLVGFSFGGVVAGHLAALIPHRVRRLVLIGAGGLGLPRPPPPALVKWAALPASQQPEAHRANLAAVMIADPSRIDDLALYLQAENTRRARLRSRSVSVTDTLRRKLAEARVPLAGIWGTCDAMTGEYIETRRKLLLEFDPYAPFLAVKGAGHWVAYEEPDAVEHALISWMDAPKY
jgi:pimeloyl-ACP methyl ester carboxylesterase